jgi:hypothetical protein
MDRATATCERVRPEFSPRRTVEWSASSARTATTSAPRFEASPLAEKTTAKELPARLAEKNVKRHLRRLVLHFLNGVH